MNGCGQRDRRWALSGAGGWILVGLLVVGVSGCRGNPKGFVQGIDELARVASSSAGSRTGLSELERVGFESRVRTSLTSIEDLPEQDAVEVLGAACDAKDVYDLANPESRAQAVEDYSLAGPRGAAFRGLLRDFGELKKSPTRFGTAKVTVNSVCAAAGLKP